jgi:L-lactate dehydrogenase complex protein LldG
MTTADRDAFLSRIRLALKSSVLPDALAVLPPYAPPSPLPLDSAALVESFVREVQVVGGETFQPATAAEANALVVRLIQETGEVGGNEVLSWPDEELPLSEIGAALSAAGIKRTQVNLAKEADVRLAQMPDLDRPLVGLTGALAGLADTGSLALLSGPTRPRTASLLPLTHIALLPIKTLYPAMAAFLAAYSASALTDNSSNLVFVSGPSRTGDIEMVLSRGVHGPKRLLVVLLKE